MERLDIPVKKRTVGLQKLQSDSLITCALRSSVNPVIDTTDHTEGNNADGTDKQCQTGVRVALNGRQRILAVFDVHGLDNEKVVVKTDHCIDQCDEDDEIRQEIARLTRFKRSHEHEEL